MKIEPGTKLLLDTNVLLEATDEGRPQHAGALGLFLTLPALGIDLFLATQVIREYLVVATRPAENNGLGMNPADALDNIRAFRQRTSVIADSEQAGEAFLALADRVHWRGKRLHDLQLLATAMTAGMNALITANPQDFPPDATVRIIPLFEA